MTPDPRRWKALVLVCAAFFMVVLDVSIVNVALPSIALDLELSQSTLQWIITAYSLAFGGFLLLGGRAADVLGRRKVFIAGMALFTFGSLMCGFAQGGAWLIAFRALQGLGGAIVSPATLVDHQRRLPARRRGAEQGVRHLGRGRRERRGGRRAARRRPDRVLRLAVDLLRQRAGRDHDHRAHVSTGFGRTRRGRRPAHGPARCPARDGRARLVRLRDVSRARSRLGLVADDRPDDPRGDPDRNLLRERGEDRLASPSARAVQGSRRRRRQPRRLLHRRRDLRRLLPAQPLHAAGARLLADPGRASRSSRPRARRSRRPERRRRSSPASASSR